MKKSFKTIWHWICVVIGTLLFASGLIEFVFLRQGTSKDGIISAVVGIIILYYSLRKSKSNKEK